MTRTCLIFSMLLLLILPLCASGAEISGAEVQFANSEILVSTALVLDEKGLGDVKSGIAKELTFYIDVYRTWKVWPDEFISGKKIVRTLRSDPVKKEYTATSFDGSTQVKKRFKDLDSLLAWALSIRELRVLHVRELEPATYFVRVTVESRIRSLPPVIGYLLFFMPEKEFRLVKDSQPFTAGEPR